MKTNTFDSRFDWQGAELATQAGFPTRFSASPSDLVATALEVQQSMALEDQALASVALTQVIESMSLEVVLSQFA